MEYEEPMRLGLYGCWAVAATFGAVVGWCRSDGEAPNTALAKGACLILAVSFAASEATTFGGFTIVLLSSVGSYKLSEVIGFLGERLIGRRLPKSFRTDR